MEASVSSSGCIILLDSSVNGREIPSMQLQRLVLIFAILVTWHAAAHGGALDDPGTSVQVIRVVDGDTFIGRLPEAGSPVSIRIRAMDAPETRSARCDEERELGRAATQRLTSLLGRGPVILRNIGRDRYGRMLAHVEADGEAVAAVMIVDGLARPYRGERRLGWCS
jgi:endonuclease YncB( thermonuclease family)